MLVGYPNTRKHQEALVGAYFGIYDGSGTSVNKGTLAVGLGAAGPWVLLWMYGTSDYQGGVAEKRAGASGNGVENIPPHSHKPFTKHWPITRKKKGCSGLEHPFYGGNGKTGGTLSSFRVKIL